MEAPIGSDFAKFPVIFPVSREFPARDGFARDWLLSQTDLLILRYFCIIGREWEKGALPGALRAPAIAAVQERAARRRLSANRTGISLPGIDPLAELTGGLNAPSYPKLTLLREAPQNANGPGDGP